jgi:hypothetical protein
VIQRVPHTQATLTAASDDAQCDLGIPLDESQLGMCLLVWFERAQVEFGALWPGSRLELHHETCVGMSVGGYIFSRLTPLTHVPTMSHQHTSAAQPPNVMRIPDVNVYQFCDPGSARPVLRAVGEMKGVDGQSLTHCIGR